MAQKSSIQPINGKVLIKRLEEKEEKKGSIIIPDTAKEKPQQGKVIAVSLSSCSCESEKKKAPECECLNEGDIVLFGKYSGTDIEINGEEYVIMDKTDILAIINK